MKLTIKQLKRLIKEQIEESSTAANEDAYVMSVLKEAIRQSLKDKERLDYLEATREKRQRALNRPGRKITEKDKICPECGCVLMRDGACPECEEEEDVYSRF